MNQAFHLFRLQQIDTQLDQSAASLAELNRLLAGDETVRQALQAVETTTKTLQQAQQRLKQAEFAVHDQQMKIGQSDASLYSGRLHNPKELQDLQKDIVSLKKHLATLEDKQLEAMLAVEEAEGNSKSAQAALTSAQVSFTEKSAGWLGQKDQQLRNQERLQAERSAAITAVTRDSFTLYDSLRKKKSGVAVTTVREGACSVCGATIRPSELQAARAAQTLVFCTSCGRILYAG
ncbi:MAG TPA: C4-type zinc ribbon domain-containing protein [Anaerolineaceae bacterium]